MKKFYGVCHAWLDISGHKEVLRIESSRLKRLLIRLFYDNVGYVPGQGTIDNWINMFHAMADFEGPTYPLSVRVAWHNGDIYYDLTSEKWESVRITREGWELLDSTPIPMFTRYNQIPQQLPNKNYEADIFDRFLGLTNLKDEKDRILLKVYIVSLLDGRQGSAKSTLQNMIKLLIDPAKPKLLTVYKDVKEFIQQLSHNHVAYYDNLKKAPGWLSDEACKACTGVGSTKRKLYSDDSDVVYEYKRCLGFNGINSSLTEPDALERSIMIELLRIDKKDRKSEDDIMAEYYELNILLDCAVDNHIDVRDKLWPKSANVFTRRLNQISSNLSEGLGIDVQITRMTRDNTSWVKVLKISPEPPEPPEGRNHEGKQAKLTGDIEGSGDILSPVSQIPPVISAENRAQNDGSGDTGDTGGILRTNGLTEEENISKLREYDRLSALARKNMKA